MSEQDKRAIADEFCDANIVLPEIELEIAKTGRAIGCKPAARRTVRLMMLCLSLTTTFCPPGQTTASEPAPATKTRSERNCRTMTQRLVCRRTARHDAAKEAFDDLIGEWLETHPPTQRDTNCGPAVAAAPPR